VAQERQRGVFAWFKGAGLCYSALSRRDDTTNCWSLWSSTRIPSGPTCSGACASMPRGLVDKAIVYTENRAGITPEGALARFAEEALLQAGRRVEAYERYAIEADQANSRLRLTGQSRRSTPRSSRTAYSPTDRPNAGG
jgi:hypothetical protein